MKNDSDMIRMIRASKQLIWIFAWGAPNHPTHFGIIFDSGPARIIRIILESFLIRARIQDPRFLGGLPKESWIQYLPESSESFCNHFKIQDSWERLLGNLGSWIPARIKNDSKMIG